MIHAYRLGGLNIVLDIASGSIHSVDDAAFDAIRMYEHGGAYAAAEVLGREHPGLSDADVSELISDVEALKREGKLFSTDNFTGSDWSADIRPLKALCMNVSNLCNMSCTYCFAGTSPAAGADPLPCMSLETGRAAVDFLMENSKGRRNLDIDFFGGEPLLNWDVVKGIVRYAREKERGSGKVFRFTLTTNGLLIDDDVIEFSNREMHNVVLSLDGRPGTNDAKRLLRNGGGGSYATVLPKIKRLVEERGGRGYYVRGTFTRENLDFTEDILHLADLGFTELAMEPVVAKPGEPYELTEEDLPAIFEQYEKLALEMAAGERQGREFSLYQFTLDLAGAPCVYKRLAGCGVGTEYLAVTPDGGLYPCHRFVGESGFLMGSVFNGVNNETLRREFGVCGILSKDECRKCWARYYCSGGCAAGAYYASGSIGGIYGLGCEILKKRIECAIMLKVSLEIDAS